MPAQPQAFARAIEDGPPMLDLDRAVARQAAQPLPAPAA